MIRLDWQAAAEIALGQPICTKTKLTGGDFADSYRVTLGSGLNVFVKTHRCPPAKFFSTEAIGLNWLRETDTVALPAVLAVSDDPPFLALEWIELGGAKRSTERNFGRALAKLHQCSIGTFGRPDSATTGSQALPNKPCANWPEFYATRRLLPLAQIAKERGVLPDSAISRLTSIADRLLELGGPSEPAALLHGDLWAGNRLVDSDGRSWLIDPAAHGGHREFDLALMRLFGGYSNDCFDAYAEINPLAPGWRDRIALHQLAPLTVHAIKFGGHYIQATIDAIGNY